MPQSPRKISPIESNAATATKKADPAEKQEQENTEELPAVVFALKSTSEQADSPVEEEKQTQPIVANAASTTVENGKRFMQQTMLHYLTK